MEVFKHHGRRLTRTNLTRWVLRVQHRASGSTAGLSNPSTHPHLSRTPALCCQRSAAGRFAAPAKLLPWLEAASKAALVKPRSGCLPAQRRPPGAPGCPCSTAPVPPSLHPSFLPSRAGTEPSRAPPRHPRSQPRHLRRGRRGAPPAGPSRARSPCAPSTCWRTSSWRAAWGRPGGGSAALSASPAAPPFIRPRRHRRKPGMGRPGPG